MRLFIKISRWTAITIAGMLLLLFSLSFALHDRVINIVLASINHDILTTVSIDGSNLSFLRRFPKASVELRNVSVTSSPSFDRKQFENINTDTLLTSPSVILELSLTDILKNKYNIESLIINGGTINLYSDSAGGVNYEITSDSQDTTAGDDMVINLDKIIISGLRSRYINTATSLDISGIIENGRMKSRISGDKIDFICSASLLLEKFKLYSAVAKPDASIILDLNLHQSDSGTTFRKGIMKLEDFRFGLSGFISSTDLLDLNITGQNINLARLKKYLPGEYQKAIDEYTPEGIVKTDCKINGYLSRTENPSITVLVNVENGSILHRKSNISIRNLSFSGSFTNGRKRRPESGTLQISELKFNLGSSLWQGSLRISDFSDPSLDATFSGDIIPSEIMSFINIPDIVSSEGSFRLNLNLSGHPGKKNKYSLSDFILLNPEANIEFSSFGFEHKNHDYSVSDIDGNIMFAKNLWAENLVFNYKGQRFRVNGEFDNLPAWLAGSPVRIKAVADISASDLNPLLLSDDTAAVKDGARTAYRLPAGIDATINFSIENLTIKTFRAGNISGKMIYKPGYMELKSLRINALNGSISGDCFIAQERSKSFISKGDLTFDNIDVNQAFRSFNNFGQDFIIAENLGGSLSGTLSILMPLDSMFIPNEKMITAEGRYLIENGRLVNFEPVKSLSGYIELSELEDITFSRLENDFFIRNNYLALPQMDIKSSAADFSVNGKHSFDYNYQYHVRVYLSEILSRKVRRPDKNSSEFGAVEDDGLGRTYISLIITGDDENIKVAYDFKAAGKNVKQSLKNEKTNLKTILNQEYGWFKEDTTVKQEPAPKPKYRIQFDEIDSASVKDTLSVKSEKSINRIFKRKKEF
jgi:hypothetical protein